MMSHWAFPLLGRPWEAGAEGPNSFNCWGFVRYVQHKHFKIEVARIEVDNASHTAVMREFKSNPERDRWVTVDKPQEGDLVEMGSQKHPHHIGVWVDAGGGGVLHCVEGHGVAFQSIGSLKLHGWSKLTYLRHRSKA